MRSIPDRYYRTPLARMNVSAANLDYAKTNRVAGRAQRVRSRRKSVHRNEGSNLGSSSHSARGQDLSDRQQPIALTTDSDAGRFLQARTNMFRQPGYVTPWMRMRTCNVLRNTYACDERNCQIIFVIEH